MCETAFGQHFNLKFCVLLKKTFTEIVALLLYFYMITYSVEKFVNCLVDSKMTRTKNRSEKLSFENVTYGQNIEKIRINPNVTCRILSEKLRLLKSTCNLSQLTLSVMWLFFVELKIAFLYMFLVSYINLFRLSKFQNTDITSPLSKVIPK